MLTIERLKEVLSYDPSNGEFRHKRSHGAAKAGEVAGALNGRGYRQISIDNRLYVTGRLAWFYVHGCWPCGQVDHINRDRLDDRLANLRDVSRRQNIWNRSLPTRKNGVYFKSKWCAVHRGQHLGHFDSPEEAEAAFHSAVGAAA